MFWKKSLETLRQELDEVNREIANNPLSESSVAEASALIEQFKEEGREAHIDDELASRGLPSAEEIGKLIVQHSFGLARLNKKRIKLETKIAQLS
ncbi:hypothetical protein [Arcanobacterium phocae]|uniref:hypothetical protein n=1 Tax=Arcanobacterium phocae TaxID=131112 RepID=UPI001C0F0BE2|nr:hypothetical protein [Arcanobacterium phocae]